MRDILEVKEEGSGCKLLGFVLSEFLTLFIAQRLSAHEPLKSLNSRWSHCYSRVSDCYVCSHRRWKVWILFTSAFNFVCWKTQKLTIPSGATIVPLALLLGNSELKSRNQNLVRPHWSGCTVFWAILRVWPLEHLLVWLGHDICNFRKPGPDLPKMVCATSPTICSRVNLRTLFDSSKVADNRSDPRWAWWAVTKEIAWHQNPKKISCLKPLILGPTCIEPSCKKYWTEISGSCEHEGAYLTPEASTRQKLPIRT